MGESKLSKEKLSNEMGKVTLPDELQKKMFKFFLETSIPRKKKELTANVCPLSENEKTDRGDEDVKKYEEHKEESAANT